MLWNRLRTSSRSAAMSWVRTSSTMSVSPDTRDACSTSRIAISLVSRPRQAGWAMCRYTYADRPRPYRCGSTRAV